VATVSSEAGSGDSRAGRGPGTLLFVILLVVVAVVGAALRVDALASRYDDRVRIPGDVRKYYIGTADSYLRGDGWVPKLEYNYIPPPLQSAFMVAVWSVAPDARLGTLRAIQTVISVLSIGLAFSIGYLLAGRWAGLIAAALIALDADVIELVGFLLTENNYFFLLFAFIAVLLCALRRDALTLFAASGALLGLASLMKPFPMLLAVVIPTCLALQYRNRRGLKASLLFIAAFGLVVSPWLIRNSLRYDHLYPISTNSGVLLAQSNFLALDPRQQDMVFWESIYARDIWKSPEIEERFRDAVDRHGTIEWNEKDRAYAGHALGYIANHPLHFLRNYCIKLYNSFAYPKARSDQSPARHYYRVSLIYLGLAGLALFAVSEWRKPNWIMVPVFAYYVGFTALYHITRWGRINLPMKLLLSFFTAYLLVEVGRRVTTHLDAVRARRPDPSLPQP